LYFFGLSQNLMSWVTAEAKLPPSGEAAGKLPPPATVPWSEGGYSGAPPNPISFPSASRYVILRPPFVITLLHSLECSGIGRAREQLVAIDQVHALRRKPMALLNLRSHADS
jgi:hypothetical protein